MFLSERVKIKENTNAKFIPTTTRKCKTTKMKNQIIPKDTQEQITDSINNALY